MSITELQFAARSQQDVRKIMADRGRIVRQWQTPGLTVSFVRMEPWRVSRTRIHELERRALRKLMAIPEVGKMFSDIAGDAK